MKAIIYIWRGSLKELLVFYEVQKRRIPFFFLKLFLFFTCINITCYWAAMLSAFPDTTFGAEGPHYFKVQFPVGLLGALFDSLSFFITLYIARQALKTKSTTGYLSHLSVDLFIAILATFWVLFVFSFSGWLISLIEFQPESFAVRNAAYEMRAVEALRNPTANFRNIYFGLVMGISAMLPTAVHLSMAFRAICKYTSAGKSVRSRFIRCRVKGITRTMKERPI